MHDPFLLLCNLKILFSIEILCKQGKQFKQAQQATVEEWGASTFVILCFEETSVHFIITLTQPAILW
jgi:hypothetical protein